MQIGSFAGGAVGAQNPANAAGFNAVMEQAGVMPGKLAMPATSQLGTAPQTSAQAMRGAMPQVWTSGAPQLAQLGQQMAQIKQLIEALVGQVAQLVVSIASQASQALLSQITPMMAALNQALPMNLNQGSAGDDATPAQDPDMMAERNAPGEQGAMDCCCDGSHEMAQSNPSEMSSGTLQAMLLDKSKPMAIEMQGSGDKTPAPVEPMKKEAQEPTPEPEPKAEEPAPRRRDDGPDFSNRNTAQRALSGGLGYVTAADRARAQATLGYETPVALDMNKDGKIGTTGTSTAKDRTDPTLGRTVEFDIDADGTKDTIEWMTGDGDGLVVDMSEIGPNGEIDGRALMGDQGGQFTDGFAKMATYDANGDGVLAGDELNAIGVWVDDGDAKLEEGELKSAAEIGLNGLTTSYANELNDRGETLMRSTADMMGEEIMSEDVWFGSAD